LGERKDIIAIDLQLFQNRPWYFKQFAKKNPAFYKAIKPEAEQFLVSLRKFESGKLIPGDNKIMIDYQALLKVLLKNAEKQPVYFTPDVLEYLQGFGIDYTKKVVPYGVLLRANPQGSKLPELKWNLVFLRKAAKQRNDLDKATIKIIRYHALAAYWRGAYLLQYNQKQEVEKFFELSKELDPSILGNIR
jgi:hypothetical protein